MINMVEFNALINILNALKVRQQHINQQIYNLKDAIYREFKCEYLRVCTHCGQDGSDTILECDFWHREVRAGECDILQCNGAKPIRKKPKGE